jgi:hypothetical protein
MNETDIRCQLRTFVKKCAKMPGGAVLADDTPILAAGLLTSLDVAQLFLFIESLRGSEIDLSQTSPEVLASVDTLWTAFFAPGAPAAVRRPA